MHPGARRARPTNRQPSGGGFACVSPSEKRRAMIPRSLVPFDARPSTLEPTARRRPSALDDRTLVPAGLQVAPLETKSNIPTNLPLASIAERFVVPRDVKPEEFVFEDKPGLAPQPSGLDARITVPVGAVPP